MAVLAVRIVRGGTEGDDRDMVRDLVAAGSINAVEKIREAINREMGNIIPGGLAGIQGLQGLL